MEYVVAYRKSMSVHNVPSFKSVRFILLTESIDKFEARVGAVASAAILDGEVDVVYCLCSRQCFYGQRTGTPPTALTSNHL